MTEHTRFQFSLVQSLSRVQLFAILWTVASQTPLSMGFFQARILDWVAILYSRGSSWPRYSTHVSCVVFCVVGGFFTTGGFQVAQ